jgi:hypothetical protein
MIKNIFENILPARIPAFFKAWGGQFRTVPAIRMKKSGKRPPKARALIEVISGFHQGL